MIRKKVGDICIAASMPNNLGSARASLVVNTPHETHQDPKTKGPVTPVLNKAMRCVFWAHRLSMSLVVFPILRPFAITSRMISPGSKRENPLNVATRSRNAT